MKDDKNSAVSAATGPKNNLPPTDGQIKSASQKNEMESSQLMQLFEDELKDIYWAEQALTNALPKMIENATSPALSDALKSHLEETKEQVKRVEQVFRSIGKNAEAKKCEAMAGLIKESEEIMKNCEKGAMRDAGIISAGQKVEHYEIATYGTLHQFAETLGLKEAAELLEESLEEEKAADDKLSQVATTAVNIKAAKEQKK